MWGDTSPISGRIKTCCSMHSDLVKSNQVHSAHFITPRCVLQRSYSAISFPYIKLPGKKNILHWRHLNAVFPSFSINSLSGWQFIIYINRSKYLNSSFGNGCFYSITEITITVTSIFSSNSNYIEFINSFFSPGFCCTWFFIKCITANNIFSFFSLQQLYDLPLAVPGAVVLLVH